MLTSRSQFNILIAFLMALIHMTFGGYVMSDQVQVGQKLLFDGDSKPNVDADDTKTSHVTFATAFANGVVPQVFVGYNTIDFLCVKNFGTYSKKRNFNLEVQTITNTGFDLKFTKLSYQQVFEMSIDYVAINSIDAYVGTGSIIDFETTADNFSPTKRQKKTNIQYQLQCDPSTHQRKVSAFFTGYQDTISSDFRLYDHQFSLELTIIQNPNDFDIVFTVTSTRVYEDPVVFINYNYIEYVERIINPYYKFNQIILNDLNPAPSGDPLAVYESGNEYRYHEVVPISIGIETLSGIFRGLSSAGIQPDQSSLRVRLTNTTFTPGISGSDSTLKFNVTTWDNTKIEVLVFQVLAFTKRDCSTEVSTPFLNSSTLDCEGCLGNTILVWSGSTPSCQQNCNPSCLTCSDSSNTGCLTCDNLYFYNNQCTPAQPDGTYCDASTKICDSCNAGRGCKTCNSTRDSCLSCLTGLAYLGGCVAAQPPKTYCIGDSCSNCISDCLTCSDGTTCDQCDSSYYYYNNICTSPQPGGTYCLSQICYACPAGCSACTSDSNCTTCANSNDYLYAGLCQSSRPNRTYCDGSQVCSTCQSSDCDICSYNLTTCNQCLSPNFLLNGKCSGTPPTNSFCDEQKICQDCMNICASCSNGTTCDTCKSNYIKYGTTCYNPAPQKTYCNATDCFDCPTRCQTCTSSTVCTSCTNPSDYLYNSGCVDTQPAKTNCDTTSRVCLACLNTNCQVCQSNLTTCDSCIGGYYFLNGACTNPKQSNSFCTGYICTLCQATCATCSNGTSCDSCVNPNFLYNNQCWTGLPPSTYCVGTICFTCPPGCTACTSPTLCQSCNSTTYYLYNQMCTTTKPSHAYCDANKVCTECDPSCLTCFAGASPSSCLTCPSTFSNFYSNSCFPTPPPGTVCIPSGGYSICMACPSQCGTCNVAKECLTCQSAYPYLYQSDCFAEQPDKTYCDFQKKCQLCTYPCENCFGPTNFECYSCITGFYIQSSQCICNEKQKYFERSTSICTTRGLDNGDDTTSNYLKIVSNSAWGASLTFALSSGYTGSYSTLLQQTFTTQKIFYLLLVNAWIPQYFYEFLDHLSSKGIKPKFDSFNAIEEIWDPSNFKKDVGYRFQFENISADFLQYGGGAISVLILVLIGQAFFIILIKLTKNSHITLLYDKVACGFFQQTMNMTILVIVFSLSLGITSLFKTSDGTAEKVCIIIFLFSGVTILMYYQRAILKKGQFFQQLETGQIMKILEEKIRNNCIGDGKSLHMYMAYIGVIECFIFPLVSVFTRGDVSSSMTLLILVQLIEFLLTAILRPFSERMQNIVFIIEHGLFVVGFILFSVLVNSLNQLDLSTNSYPNSINTMAFLITTILLLAVIVNPLSQFLGVVFLIHQKIKNCGNKQQSPQSPLLYEDENYRNKIVSNSLDERKMESVKKNISVELSSIDSVRPQ